MIAKPLKIRSIDDIDMDIEAIKRVIEHLVGEADKFYAERDIAFSLIYQKELGIKPNKKVLAKA